MKHTMSILALLAIAGFVCGTALAQDESGTLWDQETTASDGYAPINPKADGYAGPTGDTAADSITNWIYQYGSGSYTGIYRKDGWQDITDVGDSTIDIECDIEMYYAESFEDNKMYFHVGNIGTAVANKETDLTAIVTGSFNSNNGMYIGISFDGTSKTPEDMVQVEGAYTGEVTDAMVLVSDVLGRTPPDPIDAAAFPVKFSLQWDGSGWQAPVSYGTGASGTILNTLWWLVNDGAKGNYNVQWKVELLPEADQDDGNYSFDPAVVVAPVL